MKAKAVNVKVKAEGSEGECEGSECEGIEGEG